MAGKAATLKILGNNLDAKAKLDEIKAEADRLREDNPELTVKINRAQAAAEMAVLKEQLKVEADKPIVQKIKAKLDGVDWGKLGSGALWGTGIAAAAGPGVAAVGVLTAGVLGLGSALVPAVAGLGLFGAVVKSGITRVETADKAHKQLAGGLGELQTSLKSASSAWSGFLDTSLKNGGASTIAKAIGLIPIGLKQVQPLLAPVEKGLDGIIAKLGTGLKSQGFSNFINVLSFEAGPSITKLGGILGHLGSIAGKVVLAFQGMGQSVLGDLDKILGKADADTDSALFKFLTWVRANGPEIMGILKNLGTTVANMGKSFIGLGRLDIGAFSAIASLLATISRNPIGASALVGLLVLTKVGAAVGPLVKMVLAFKELSGVINITKIAMIGLDAVPIVLVITLIIAAIVLLITHWNTVKAVAVRVWHDITGAVSTAFNWVKGHWPLILGILTGPIGMAAIFIIRHWDQIVHGAESMIGRVTGFFRSLPGKILSVLGNLGSLLWNAGKSIISGLINGIENAVPGLHTALGWVTSLIPSWKGPPEKDASLLRPAGRLIMGGLVGGLQDGIPGLHAQLARTTNQIASTKVASALGGSNANAPLQVEWVGGQGDQEFMTWLKKNIRIRGGNPDVLGR